MKKCLGGVLRHSRVLELVWFGVWCRVQSFSSPCHPTVSSLSQLLQQHSQLPHIFTVRFPVTVPPPSLLLVIVVVSCHCRQNIAGSPYSISHWLLRFTYRLSCLVSNCDCVLFCHISTFRLPHHPSDWSMFFLVFRATEGCERASNIIFSYPQLC